MGFQKEFNIGICRIKRAGFPRIINRKLFTGLYRISNGKDIGFQWNYFRDRSQVKTYWRYSGPAAGSTYNVWMTPKGVALRTLREAEKAGFRG